jgi:tetratricopeptide (TPR) repeat protein
LPDEALNFSRHTLSFFFSLVSNMRTALKTSGPASVQASVLRCQRRHITRLYTSYYKGELYPSQLVRPLERLPRGVSLAAARKGQTFGATPVTAAAASASKPAATLESVSWDDVDSTDLVHVNGRQTAVSPEAGLAPRRPYVPLGEVAKLELQGDYLTEGGLHQEALEYYGVVAKAYELAYPLYHPQIAGIRVKLAGAFRRTNRLESSKANCEAALQMLDSTPQPSLELIVEALLELGMTAEAMKDATAGSIYEEAVTLVDTFHNAGQSHKMLRLLPRLGRRFSLNYEEKFLYFSPFDFDRVFALADQCLARAEAFYEGKDDRVSMMRVLQQRKVLIDKKFFNMRDFAGRIHTMRGHWQRRTQHLTNAPTPDELLRYSPTIHQVHRDFKYELTAPNGREGEVQPGVNRVVQDSGNPYRRRGFLSQRMMRDADKNFAKYVRANEFGE